MGEYLSGRRETRTLTISRHILSVVRLPIPPLAPNIRVTEISIACIVMTSFTKFLGQKLAAIY